MTMVSRVYEKPLCEVVEINLESRILNGSDYSLSATLGGSGSVENGGELL